MEDREPRPLGEVDVELLYSTTKADVWAREFAKVRPEVDEGLMLAWFANAIERGRTAGEADSSAKLGECDQHIDALREAREALRFTREYVGEGLLPAKAGWAWFDATCMLDALLQTPDDIDARHPSPGGNGGQTT